MKDEKRRAAAIREAQRLAVGLDRFNALVDEFVGASDITQTRFSIEAGGHIDFLRHLRTGRDHRLGTVRRVVEFMAKGRDVDFVSPPRPEKSDLSLDEMIGA